MQEYQVQLARFRLPKDWWVHETPRSGVLFVGWAPGEFPRFAPQLNITQLELADSVDAEHLKLGNQVGLQRHLVDYRPLGTSVPGDEPPWIHYAGLTDGWRFTALDFFLAGAGQGLILHLKAPCELFADYQATFEQIGRSAAVLLPCNDS